MVEKLRSTKLKLILSLVAITLTSVIGISVAYFSISVTGNETVSSIRTTAADLKLKFTDGPGINIVDVYPGWSTTKTFSVQNTGSDTAYYDIQMYNVYSTFVRDDLVYTLSSTNSGGSKTETIMPNNDGLIKAKISIPKNTTQTFTMTIRFKELNTHQDYNQAAEYSGVIQILSPYKYTDGLTAQDITLRERILLDNTEAPLSNALSKYVTTSTGINYGKPSDYGYVANNYYIYEETVNFTSSSSSKKALGTAMSFDSNSGTFTLSGTTSTGQVYSEDAIGKYTCNSTSTTCYSNPQDVYRILEVNGSTVTKVARYVAKPKTTIWNGLGLYQTSTNTEGNQPTYFFRGHIVNNYVSFAGEIWRILRINEDGTIRLIRQSNYSSSKFHSVRSSPMHVGFMFGTTDEPYTNDNNSAIKTVTENYYTAKLASYASYLADAGFCGDRDVNNTSGAKVYYRAYTRLVSNKTPQFKCGRTQADEDRDLYTTSSATKGNRALTYPVGLITADELSFAGGVNGKVSKFYLNISSGFWAMTPSYYSSYAYLFYSYTGGVVGSTTASGSSYATRPVINLKADTLVLGGSGTSNDPYKVTQ